MNLKHIETGVLCGVRQFGFGRSDKYPDALDSLGCFPLAGDFRGHVAL